MAYLTPSYECHFCTDKYIDNNMSRSQSICNDGGPPTCKHHDTIGLSIMGVLGMLAADGQQD